MEATELKRGALCAHSYIYLGGYLCLSENSISESHLRVNRNQNGARGNVLAHLARRYLSPMGSCHGDNYGISRTLRWSLDIVLRTHERNICLFSFMKLKSRTCTSYNTCLIGVTSPAITFAS